MYYIYGISGPSLLMESTDSMIMISNVVQSRLSRLHLSKTSNISKLDECQKIHYYARAEGVTNDGVVIYRVISYQLYRLYTLAKTDHII